MMYDAEVGEFGNLITAGGLEIDPILHPFLVIRAQSVAEHKCPRLPGCIRRLMRERAIARARRAAEIAAFEVEVLGLPAGNNENTATDELDWEWDEIETGPGVRVMVIFEDDPADSDYVDGSSEGSTTEEEGILSEEEEEAVETDTEVEVKKRIFIDLTTLSDTASECSQEI